MSGKLVQHGLSLIAATLLFCTAILLHRVSIESGHQALLADEQRLTELRIDSEILKRSDAQSALAAKEASAETLIRKQSEVISTLEQAIIDSEDQTSPNTPIHKS